MTAASRMFDASVRVDQMLWIPGMPEGNEAFEDFLENDLGETYAQQVTEALPWLAKCAKEYDNDMETICGELAIKRVAGFLVHMSTPVPTNFHKSGNGYQCSWGYTRGRWVYVETMDDLVDLAEAFGAEVVERERSKAAGKAS
jgi:hypothetical protein